MTTDNQQSTTGTVSAMTPLSAEQVRRVIRDLPDLFGPIPTEWLLMSPQGVLYHGSPEQLFPILAKEHPLLKGNHG